MIFSRFCHFGTLGTNWGQKSGVFEAFMQKRECLYFTGKKIGDKLI